jgi:hypothetical protein
MVKEKKVDVLILPSHTSNFAQPLDLSVNAEFKRYLNDLKYYPGKNKTKENINSFVREIRQFVHGALKPHTIISGFLKALIINKENNIDLLEKEINKLLETFPPRCPEFLQVFLHCVITKTKNVINYFINL